MLSYYEILAEIHQELIEELMSESDLTYEEASNATEEKACEMASRQLAKGVKQ